MSRTAAALLLLLLLPACAPRAGAPREAAPRASAQRSAAPGRAAAAPGEAAPARSAQRTYANPLDIGYMYNFEQEDRRISYRSGADPVIVVYRGEYYLFLTLAGGWWHSKDLLHWEHVTPDKWPIAGVVAPAALVAKDTLFLMPSTFERATIFSTTTPWDGRLDFYHRLLPELPDSAPGPWDPALFHDSTTGRWFLYYGSSNTYPLFVVSLDPAKRLGYAGEPRPLRGLDPEHHGWERFGRDHADTRAPFIEGAWMTEHDGRYYLQYGAPGTEYNVYANGTWVADDPLGPFTYPPYNPVSYKPGGFMVGAGHGNTFRDVHGNWWNTGTAWVAVNWNFERRVVMFPAGFDADGDMYADTRFGDFPHYIPTEEWTDPSELFTGWMLLSYRKPATASSVRDTFPASNVTDENPRTFWVAERNAPDQWLQLDLGRAYDVRALQVNYTDYQSDLFASDSTVYTRFRVRASLDGRSWSTVADLGDERRDRPNAYIELPEPVRARYLRYEHGYVASPNLAISDFRVFGTGDGPSPRTPAGFTVRRDTDRRNAEVSWRPVPGAVGYNVRWGIGPAKLRQTYQVFADRPTRLEVRALNVEPEYWFAIEAFDENGVSSLSRVVRVP